MSVSWKVLMVWSGQSGGETGFGEIVGYGGVWMTVRGNWLRVRREIRYCIWYW